MTATVLRFFVFAGKVVSYNLGDLSRSCLLRAEVIEPGKPLDLGRWQHWGKLLDSRSNPMKIVLSAP
jgi:hypothetical protein